MNEKRAYAVPTTGGKSALSRMRDMMPCRPRCWRSCGTAGANGKKDDTTVERTGAPPEGRNYEPPKPESALESRRSTIQTVRMRNRCFEARNSKAEKDSGGKVCGARRRASLVAPGRGGEEKANDNATENEDVKI